MRPGTAGRKHPRGPRVNPAAMANRTPERRAAAAAALLLAGLAAACAATGGYGGGAWELAGHPGLLFKV